MLDLKLNIYTELKKKKLYFIILIKRREESTHF